MLSIITKSCKILNDKLKVRLPIQKRLLDLILFELERKYHDQMYLEKLFKAIFSIAYYGLMRIGEIATGTHPVKARDVHIGRNKNKILIVLFTSKTHGKESFPQKIKIEETKEKDKFFCPFKLMRDFLAVRGNYIKDSDPFFIYGDGTPVKPEQVRKTLRNILETLNLNPSLYDTHSMRIGRASDMANFGYSASQIRQAGRWRSNAMFKYITS